MNKFLMSVVRDGKYSLGYRIEDADAVIGSRMLAGMAMSVITEEMIVNPRLNEVGVEND